MKRGRPPMCPVRRRAILRDFLNEDRVSDIAARHGVSGRYVSLLASQTGLSRPHGRPSIAHDLDLNPEQMARFGAWRRHYGADAARAMIAVEAPQ